jgi:hypothetical protein
VDKEMMFSRGVRRTYRKRVMSAVKRKSIIMITNLCLYMRILKSKELLKKMIKVKRTKIEMGYS